MHYTSKQRALGTRHSLLGENPLIPLCKISNERNWIMQKRNIEIKLRLDKKEAETLNKRVKKSGLSRESYIRYLINGLVPTDAPPPDYYSMMRELHGIGNNLNQIAQKAHVLKVLDVGRYDKAVKSLDSAVLNITNAVMLPRRLE